MEHKDLETARGYETRSLEDLVAELREGPTNELASEIWRRLEPKIRRAAASEAYRKAEGMDRVHVVEQSLHSVRLRLATLAEAARIDFTGLLCLAARNNVSDQARRFRSAGKLETTGKAAERQVMSAIDGGLNPEELLLEREVQLQREALVAILHESKAALALGSRFGPRQVTVLQMRFEEGLEIQEIANRLMVGKRTAEYALKQGLDGLRAIIARYGIPMPGIFTPPDGNDNE